MEKKETRAAPSRYGAIVQTVLLLIPGIYCTAMLLPKEYTILLPYLDWSAKVVGAACLVGAHGYYNLLKIHPLGALLKALGQGTVVAGENGTGKTIYLINTMLDLFQLKHGSIFISPHGIEDFRKVVERIPGVVVLDPLRKPGLYMFTRYSWNARERNILAAAFVKLVNRLHDSWGDNIDAILSNAAIACLQYQELTKENITPETIYNFLVDEESFFRVLERVDSRPLLNALLRAKEHNKESYNKAITKLEKLLTQSTCYDFLCDTEGIDLKKLIDADRLIFCDYDPAHVGKPMAEFLAEITATLTANIILERKQGSKKYGVFMDEFHRYANETTEELPTEGRKRGAMCWFATQSLHFLSKKMLYAAAQCGTKIFFRVSSEDASLAYKMLAREYDADSFVDLPNHWYQGKLLEYGKPVYRRAKAPPLRSEIDADDTANRATA